MVNSVQRLQEMKAFIRMSSGVNPREYGLTGDIPGEMPGIIQKPDGELQFAEWNCRAGQNNVIIRTDGTVAPCRDSTSSSSPE